MVFAVVFQFLPFYSSPSTLPWSTCVFPPLDYSCSLLNPFRLQLQGKEERKKNKNHSFPLASSRTKRTKLQEIDWLNLSGFSQSYISESKQLTILPRKNKSFSLPWHLMCTIFSFFEGEDWFLEDWVVQISLSEVKMRQLEGGNFRKGKNHPKYQLDCPKAIIFLPTCIYSLQYYPPLFHFCIFLIYISRFS